MIVAKYFWSWAKVIIAVQKKQPRPLSDRIAYVDLFAGPGRYKDGTESTPLMILERAIQDSDISQRLVMIVNDKNADNVRSLKSEIEAFPGYERLKYKPQILNEEVSDHFSRIFEQVRLIPTLLFIDPWGYKGLSLDLIYSVVKDWGCDVIFFFNYNRIRPGIHNPFVEEHMNALFGAERAEKLRNLLPTFESSAQRELAIIEEIGQALKELGVTYVLPFRFLDEKGSRTSHHLIFATKSIKGYEIMKEIMAGESSKTEQGVASFEYNASDIRFPLLFELARPLDDLVEMLVNDFSGRSLTMHQVYELHHVGRPYIEKNYKQALLTLEEQGRIETNPSANIRRKNTFGPNVVVKFPRT